MRFPFTLKGNWFYHGFCELRNVEHQFLENDVELNCALVKNAFTDVASDLRQSDR